VRGFFSEITRRARGGKEGGRAREERLRLSLVLPLVTLVTIISGIRCACENWFSSCHTSYEVVLSSLSHT
jgi:hypothetical protein